MSYEENDRGIAGVTDDGRLYREPLFKDACFPCENCGGITDVEEQQWVRGLRVCADCAEAAPDAEVISVDFNAKPRK